MQDIYGFLTAIFTALAAISAYRSYLISRRALSASTRTSAKNLEMAARSMELSARIGVENQRSNVILHFNARYDELYKFRWEIDRGLGMSPSERSAAAEIFFSRYWGLHNDQINSWLNGYLDPETLSGWLMGVIHYLNGSEMVENLSFAVGWDKFGQHHKVTNNTLSKFIADMTVETVNAADELHRYGHLLLFLERTELNESSYINLMSAASDHRVTIEKLIPTLSKAQKDAVSEVRARRTDRR